MKTHPQRSLILIGPPGSGKTYLGRLLQTERGFDFADLEAILVERFGTGQEFLDNKAAALEFLRRYYETRITQHAPVVIESTGISERGMLRNLMRAHPFAIVRVDCGRDECIQRTRSQSRGPKINNSPEFTASVYDYWLSHARDAYPWDLKVSTVAQTDAALLAALQPVLEAAEDSNDCGEDPSVES